MFEAFALTLLVWGADGSVEGAKALASDGPMTRAECEARKKQDMKEVAELYGTKTWAFFCLPNPKNTSPTKLPGTV